MIWIGLASSANMIDFSSILSPSRTRTSFPASSKKRVLEQAAEVIASASSDLTSRHLFDQLMARERLGSTGLGEGVALPHCRLDGTRSIIGAFLHLDSAIDFDSNDGEPVDLIFVLVVPMDRVLVSETRGHRFKSCRAYSGPHPSGPFYSPYEEYVSHYGWLRYWNSSFSVVRIMSVLGSIAVSIVSMLLVNS